MLSEYEQAQMAEFTIIPEQEFPDKLVNVNKEALKQVIALNLKQNSNEFEKLCRVQEFI